VGLVVYGGPGRGRTAYVRRPYGYVDAVVVGSRCAKENKTTRDDENGLPQ